MPRRVKYGEAADQIVRADQGVLLIPRQVAKVEQPEASIPDHEPTDSKFSGRGILLF